jgi:hypothetical protein
LGRSHGFYGQSNVENRIEPLRDGGRLDPGG